MEGDNVMEDTRLLFSRENKQLIATTSGQNAKPSQREEERLLQGYENSENELLRMLSQDEPEGAVITELGKLFDASMASTESSIREDDDLVDAFIESRYRAARIKKRQGKSANAREGDIGSPSSRVGEDDDRSVSNMSMSSLGDHSAALYDMILPTTTVPPPQHPALGSATKLSLGLEFTDGFSGHSTNSTLPSIVDTTADDAERESAKERSEGLDDELGNDGGSIPITPW